MVRTSVPEERYLVQSGPGPWLYASDHLPIVAELAMPAGKRSAFFRSRAPASRFAASPLGIKPATTRPLACSHREAVASIPTGRREAARR